MPSDPTVPAPSGSSATDFAVLLLAELEAGGVRDVVLSPGSRSQALALAAAEYERAGRLRLHVRLDERSAGFLALGLGVETGIPAAVVTTSGTAVANLHPAVLEAHHSGVPMLLLTADRPEELRGIGSNQTTHQARMFGEALRLIRDVEAPKTPDAGRRRPAANADAANADAVNAAPTGDTVPAGSSSAGASALDTVRTLAREALSAALGHSGSPDHPAAPGPVQLNIAFREPLSAPVTTLPEPRPGHPTPLRATAAPHRLSVDSHPGTVVIAGHAAGPVAEATARALGAPLIAEVSSGARFGPNLVPSYRQLLDDDEFGGRIRRAVVYGHPTLTRQVPQLLKRDGSDASDGRPASDGSDGRPAVEVIVVRGGVPEAYDPSRSATIVETIEIEDGDARPDDPAHRDWVGRWVHTGRSLIADDGVAPDADAAVSDDKAVRAEFLRGEVEAIRRPVTRRSLVEALWRVTWPHDRLVLGASRLIREADVFVTGKKIAVHANRGLAGIDGTIATATGIGLASQGGGTTGAPAAGWTDGSTGVTRVLVGDLTLLHDAGSLLFGEGEAKPRIQVVVGNDGGGTIFDGLEVAATAPEDAMTRVQFTPQPASFEKLAAAYGWEYRRASTRGELDQALVGSPGPILIEVPLAR
ncbi:thiamine pyrophosphate-binding protein [Frondihabitans cladoniiphilus]|uniref:2-succinyl-5-enolpyruvyl-6-hydroxy-3-cyclohexene-1-carboxylate synthase n=1 Tax=Frondihabitans cladoniiphilus TaxID=715785 RepID=A0ABP8W2Z0_9MICO